MRPRSILLSVLAALLLGAAPAAAGGVVEVDGAVLRYTAGDDEPSNVTIDHVDGLLVLEENASRMTVAAPPPVPAPAPLGAAPATVVACTALEGGYRVECPDAGVERIEVQLGLLGSDVRIRADLPSLVRGGPGDDLIVGGPSEDAIDGGPGQDILAGGEGADLLHGGPGLDLVTYADRIGRDGALLGRREGVTLAVGRANASGARDERDTIFRDVEQLEGGAGDDRFSLWDGRATAVACGTGRDRVSADPHDGVEIDCENTTVAPYNADTRITTPTLPFPFASVNDRGRSAILIDPMLPLQGGAIVLRVTCPAGLGLLELVRALPCSGRVRFTRAGSEMGVRRVSVPRGGAITVRLPLLGSRALARRPQGLTITATALPDRGSVQRTLRFRVRG